VRVEAIMAVNRVYIWEKLNFGCFLTWSSVSKYWRYLLQLALLSCTEDGRRKFLRDVDSFLPY
jgi:hypothetical protein